MLVTSPPLSVSERAAEERERETTRGIAQRERVRCGVHEWQMTRERESVKGKEGSSEVEDEWEMREREKGDEEAKGNKVNYRIEGGGEESEAE